MLLVTDRHNTDHLGRFIHFIKDPIFAYAQFLRSKRIVPQRFAVLGFNQGLMRELLANLRHDELSLKGSIVRKVNLCLFCNVDPIARHIGVSTEARKKSNKKNFALNCLLSILPALPAVCSGTP